MRKVFTVIFLLFTIVAYAQQKVEFKLDSLPPNSVGNIFIAGSFNMWNPADSAFMFSQKGERGSLTVSLPAGNYEYKFTRGNWQTVEENADFKPMSNRAITINSDTVVHIKIGAWADAKPQRSKTAVNTTTPQVHIMDTAFYMPQLDRYRRIWIYLPKGYESSRKRYPVMYMHDGQNVFDAATSYSGEWGVDEFLDSLKSNCNQAIIVAVDNGSDKRMQEYNPWEFMNFGEGQGDLYVDFLVKTLKPYVDKNYRTLKNKKNTSVAGSSMGGLISLYAVMKYPKVFGSAGVFSPAFWTASGIDNTVEAKIDKVNSMLFFYAGGDEGETMLPDMYRIEEKVKSRSKSPVKDVVDMEAKHNEAAWRKYFPEFYRWVFCR